MSLTQQLKDRKSPVRQFFDQYENEEGVRNCLKLLLNNNRPNFSSNLIFDKSIKHPVFIWSFIGTASDYLIRYTANNKKINFKKTIAYNGRNLSYQHYDDHSVIADVLWDIGQFGLKGSSPSSPEAVVSAVALSILDGVYRSGCLPKMLTSGISKKESNRIKKIRYGKDRDEKEVFYLFFKYLDYMGGDSLIGEVATIVRIFDTAIRDPSSDIYDIEFKVHNKALSNSRLVGGADIDCVIQKGEKFILTDIKSIKNDLKLEHIRQLVGYLLLYTKSYDRFIFTDAGIYYSRSGCFRYMPVDLLIAYIFPKLKTVNSARKVFKKFIRSQ